MRTTSILVLCACLMFLLGCSRRQKNAPPPLPGTIAEQVGNTAIIRVDAPAFYSLTANDRVAAWYLSQAILAGRDITCDQIYPGQARALRFLEIVGNNLAFGATPATLAPYFKFLKTLQIHGGFYDLSTERKIHPENFDERDLTQAMFLAQANSGGDLGSLLDVQLLRGFIVDTLLKSSVDSILYSFKPDSSQPEILPVGLYDHISAQEARNYVEKFPANSRLARRDSLIVEEVYRVGNEEVAPGLHSSELAKVIENLEKGRPYLPPERVPVVDQLLHHLRSGDPAAFDSAAAQWRSGSAPVDFLLGFTDTRLDPLGRKGLWTGLLFIRDESAQAIVDRLLQAAQGLLQASSDSEALAPTRQIKAVQLLTAAGANSPQIPDVYCDPPCRDHSMAPSQSLIFTNVLSTRAQLRAAYVESRFCRDSSDVSQAMKYAVDLTFVQTVLAQAPGITSQSCSGCCCANMNADLNTLQETAAQAKSWWLMGDPILVGMGLIPSGASGQIYRSLARKYLISLADSAAGCDNQPLQLLGNYLLESGALKLESVAAKTICEPASTGLVRQKLIALADSLEKILTPTGDQKRREFVSKYGQPERVGLNAEVSAHLQRAGAFQHEAFILPLAEARFNPMGGIEAVRLIQPESFPREMLIYGGLETGKQKK